MTSLMQMKLFISIKTGRPCREKMILIRKNSCEVTYAQRRKEQRYFMLFSYQWKDWKKYNANGRASEEIMVISISCDGQNKPMFKGSNIFCSNGRLW